MLRMALTRVKLDETMPVPSVSDSFRERLPVLRCDPLPGGGSYRRVYASAVSTVQTDPPVAWIAEHYTVLINLAKNTNRLPPDPPNDSILREKIPQTERTHTLHTEAD